MRMPSRYKLHSLGDGALSHEFSFNTPVKLLTVYFKFAAPVSESLTITFISGDGVEYNTEIESRVLEGQTDFIYAAVGTMGLNEIDKIKVEVTASAATCSVGVSVKAEG